MRISIVQYLNTAPLVWGFSHGSLRDKYDLSFTLPSRCAEALRDGAADIAIIPAIEYQRIPDLVVLPGSSIASRKRVRSLLVLSKVPIEEARRIALDTASRSTQALTRILCAEKWKIAPEFVQAEPDLPAMLQQADAALLIGDPALRVSLALEEGAPLGSSRKSVWRRSPAQFPAPDPVHVPVYVYDIVDEWRQLTGLPAVLAVWAARTGVITSQVAADFDASKQFGLSHIADISLAASRELNLPASNLESYLRDNIDFSLDDENRRGLDLYYRHAARLGLIPEARPIVWAGGVGLQERSVGQAFP